MKIDGRRYGFCKAIQTLLRCRKRGKVAEAKTTLIEEIFVIKILKMGEGKVCLLEHEGGNDCFRVGGGFMLR